MCHNRTRLGTAQTNTEANEQPEGHKLEACACRVYTQGTPRSLAELCVVRSVGVCACYAVWGGLCYYASCGEECGMS